MEGECDECEEHSDGKILYDLFRHLRPEAQSEDDGEIYLEGQRLAVARREDLQLIRSAVAAVSIRLVGMMSECVRDGAVYHRVGVYDLLRHSRPED